MIPEIIKSFDANRENLLTKFKSGRPFEYSDIVKAVIEAVSSRESARLDPERIERIHYDDSKGTDVFVIAEKGYRPNNYWYVKVDYGSCSGCDTLTEIQRCSPQVSDEEANAYLTLALHIAQSIKKME